MVIRNGAGVTSPTMVTVTIEEGESCECRGCLWKWQRVGKKKGNGRRMKKEAKMGASCVWVLGVEYVGRKCQQRRSKKIIEKNGG